MSKPTCSNTQGCSVTSFFLRLVLGATTDRIGLVQTHQNKQRIQVAVGNLRNEAMQAMGLLEAKGVKSNEYLHLAEESIL